MLRFQISSYLDLFIYLFLVTLSVFKIAFNFLMRGLEEGLRWSVELYFNSWNGVLHFFEIFYLVKRESFSCIIS